MTEAEIRAYDNVPVMEAAKYIGATPEYVRRGILTGALPFGSAVKFKNRYSFNIPAGALIAYKNGTLPVKIYKLTKIRGLCGRA